MIDKDLLQALTEIGLEDKQARAYLATIELGTASASQIAKKAELKRSIVYYTLNQLKTAGYVQEIGSGTVKKFAAVDPSHVLQKASSAVEELRFMLPLIRALQEKAGKKPRVEYFDDREAVQTMFNLYELGKSQRYLTSMQKVARVLPEDPERWARHYEQGRVRGHSRFLLGDTPLDRAWGARVKKTGQEVRYLPKGSETEMDFAIIDGLLGITSLDPLFIVAIHSERVAKSAAALFDLAWESGKE